MYKITIEQTKTELQKTGKNWTIVAKRLVTEKDLESSAYHRDRELEQKVLNANVILMDQMGYTPEIEKEVEVQVKIFEQMVENLDIKAVIAAINKMPILGV